MVSIYASVLRRRLPLILVVALLLAPLLFLLLVNRPARFTSEAVVEVGTGALAEQLIGQESAYVEPERRVIQEADSLTSRPVAERAADRLGLDGTESDLDALLSSVDAAPRPGTNFIEVIGTGSTAEQAQQVTAAFTRSYVDNRRDLQQDELARLEQDLLGQRATAEAELAALPTTADTARERSVLTGRIDNAIGLAEAVRLRSSIDQTGVEVLSEAALPAEPSNALSPVVAALAAIAGAVFLGTAVAFVYELLRDGVRTRREVEESAQAPVIATVQRLRRRSGRAERPASVRRSVRTGLSLACGGSLPSRIMVLSDGRDADDRHDMADLLASACADSSLRVVLFADSNEDSDAGPASQVAAAGASVALLGGLVVKESLQANVWRGPATTQGADRGLFDDPAIADVLADARRHFDIVIVVVESEQGVDPRAVHPLVDAVLLVCALGRTPVRRLRRLVDLLEQDERPIDAVVLTTAAGLRNPRRTSTGSPKDAPVVRSDQMGPAQTTPAVSPSALSPTSMRGT